MNIKKIFNFAVFQFCNCSNGQSLVEILIALGIGVLIITGVSVLMGVNLQSDLSAKTAQIASSLAQETSDSAKSISESDWRKIYNLSKGSGFAYYISSSTQGIISGIEQAVVEGRSFNRYFYVENVNRTQCGIGDITQSSISFCAAFPGASSEINEDPSTQKITVVISWTNNKIEKSQYISRSRNLSFVQSDWSGGPGQESFATSTGGVIVNNKFSSSTNINYSSSTGSITIQGF